MIPLRAILTRWVKAGGLETGGALPVPEDQRRMRASGLFTVWLMTPAGVTGPLVGYLFFKYGTWNFVATVAIAFMIGFVPAGVLSEMGRDVPITSVVYARRCFGTLGTLPVAILLALVSLGFFGLTSAVIATILAAATNTSSRLWDGVVGIVAVVLVVVGIRLVERCYRYTRIVVPICYAGLVFYLAETFGLRFPSQTAPMKWGPALTLVLTLSLLSWGYVLPTVSRFLHTALEGRHTGECVVLCGSILGAYDDANVPRHYWDACGGLSWDVESRHESSRVARLESGARRHSSRRRHSGNGYECLLG